jgi:hypothetical protein
VPLCHSTPAAWPGQRAQKQRKGGDPTEAEAAASAEPEAEPKTAPPRRLATLLLKLRAADVLVLDYDRHLAFVARHHERRGAVVILPPRCRPSLAQHLGDLELPLQAYQLERRAAVAVRRIHHQPRDLERLHHRLVDPAPQPSRLCSNFHSDSTA